MNPTLEDLRTIEAFHDLPTHSLQWLAAHMDVLEAKAGEILSRAGDPAEYLNAIFKGFLRGERPGTQLIFTAQEGEVTGILPYSRLTVLPSNVYAVKDSRVGRLHKSHFVEMAQQIPDLPPRLVAIMADRIRETTRATHQQEKLMALGQLSAGLAHELNNPSAAGQRATEYLRKAVKDFRYANVKLAKLSLADDSRRYLIELEAELSQKKCSFVTLDSLDRSDREERLAAWMEKHAVADAWQLAPDLVDSGCDLQTLEQIAARLPKDYLTIALARLTASLNINRLLDEIDNSMKRITELVRSVKDYSFMDQMPEQEVDIHDGIDTTLTLLKHRLKNGIEVVREYDHNLPRMTVRGRELNQVWTNLITNAVDAMNGKGVLRIVTKCSDGKALVEVIDNGSGIPPEIRDRIFEPFFTTKGVKEGTGLGLDIAARVVRNHGGDIQVESKPGHTVFGVRLPLHCIAQEQTQEDQAVRNSG